MATQLAVLLSVWCSLVLVGLSSAQEQPEPRQTIASAFAGAHHFHYLFIENGVPYLDGGPHLQLVEVEDNPAHQTTQVAFYNHTPEGKRLHFRYVLQSQGHNITLQEFDARGQHRFDCVGTYQPEPRRLQCSALRAPKPARDLDSPLTRQLGLFKRPTLWPAYASLDRHNTFRFYEWGFVHVQDNVKVDDAGNPVARETGVISALKVLTPPHPGQRP